MPFRSETEPLREQIRRADEQAEELLEERALLEQQLAQQKNAGGRLRTKLLVSAALACVAAGAFIGAVAGDLEAEHRAKTARELREQREGQERLAIVLSARTCSELATARKSDVATCDQERMLAKWQATAPVDPRPGPRDPLPSGNGPGNGGLR